ncbi:DnaB-like helicase C-terminal domain-containing protein, partial [Clostridium sp. WILCCON 0269]
DEALNGIQQKKLYVIAGRPGMAKSAFSLNIAQNISKHKHVLYYSLEMSAEELGIRRLAMKSYIDIDTLKLEKGKMSDSQWSEISNMASTISKGHCYTDCTPGTHANTMRLQCKKLKMQNKLDVLVIDYIGIMSLKDMGDSRQEKISTVCIELKNMAKEFDIPVIALAQINRGTEIRNDKRPMLSDLKESGGIEENADVVMLLYRDGYYHKDSKEKNVIEVNIAKQRGGRTGTIKLVWQPKYQLITDKTLYDEDGIYNTDIFKHKEV